MIKFKNVDVDAALENPAAHFGTPKKLVADSRLSFADKKRLLDKWEEDARLLSVATEEGMTGGEPSLMPEIAEVKAKLGLVNENKEGPGKLG